MVQCAPRNRFVGLHARTNQSSTTVSDTHMRLDVAQTLKPLMRELTSLPVLEQSCSPTPKSCTRSASEMQKTKTGAQENHPLQSEMIHFPFANHA